MAKKFIKSKTTPNDEPKYRTPDHFKGSVFTGIKFNRGFDKGQRFANTSFRTQHKGG